MQIRATSGTIPQTLESALTKCLNLDGASDVHMVPGQPPWIRQGGIFTPHPSLTGVMSVQDAYQLATWISGKTAPEEQSGVIVQDTPEGQQRWRASTYESVNGWVTALRIIPARPPSFSALGLDTKLKAIANLSSGLILVCGATGSGKTTTCAALISELIASRPVRLITLEDPVEYLYTSDIALVSQRDIRNLDHSEVFAMSMRSDPDVAFFGELRRDKDALHILELAASGTLVFATAHAADVQSMCERLSLAVGEAGRSLISQVLSYVVSQRLVPSKGSSTKRFLASEVLAVDHSIRNILAPMGDLRRLSSTLFDRKMSFAHSLGKLYRSNSISEVSALQYAPDPENTKLVMQGIS